MKEGQNAEGALWKITVFCIELGRLEEVFL